MEKRELLSPSDDTASRALIDVQTATTRVKAIISECVSKGIPDDELTKRLNEVIAVECKRIKDAPFREQFRKALITSARKWHYQLMQTYRINDLNLENAVKNQAYNAELADLLSLPPYRKLIRFREMLDDGTNPGIPVIADYQKGVKLAIRAIAAEPAKVIVTKDGRVYQMPARARAEMVVRYAAAIDGLQRLNEKGVKFCWISSHPNCSPRCQNYQGKLYSLFDKPIEIEGKMYGLSGVIDGIPYQPIDKALSGPKDDGNGCLTGYNCRHRAIAYERGSRPPADYTEAEIKKAYAIDQKQRSFENRIRQMKQEEAQLRACGMTEEAKALRKKWRVLTRDYQIYSIQNDRAYYPYRYIVDRTELEQGGENLNLESTTISDGDGFKVVPLKQDAIKGQKYEKKFTEILPEETAHNTTVKAREILRENNRKKEETVYLLSVSNGDEVYKQHEKGLRPSIDVGKINRMPENSLVLIHNHPSGDSFSIDDLRTLIYTKQIHTMIAVSPDGKIFSLHIKQRKDVDIYAEGMYNKGIKDKISLSQILQGIAIELDWEYKEL